MELEHLKKVFNQFNHSTNFLNHKELVSGHINDTYLIETSGDSKFVLQRINHLVFKDVPGLVTNKVNVSKHLLTKLKHLPKNELKRRVLSFVPAKNGDYYYNDINGNYWNLMVFIEDSVTFETVKNEEVAYEGGKLFGRFLNLTSDFDASKLTEVIPKFHDMSFRFSQFEESLKVATKERLTKAKDLIEKVHHLKEEMHIIQRLKESGEIQLRVTHNDTKISNALFDKNNKGLCVIDTDTVMPGVVHYDFGDAIRTICNTASEDEKNLELVNFNLDLYKAYTKGFLEEVESALTPTEIKYLPLAAKTMIFIMAIRFLTDYLNGNIYYKVAYPEHNFDRAKNQLKLIESFEKQFTETEVKINKL
ncbi:phosphotransferase enzyme family protein [Lutibacter aestuarii]|uniref:Phosphotransferase enzyme family protein n=1 Tax=Lutibacter aestuarii TaxID=861111 RepID=A0ABW2Z245_9FLAO